MFQKKLVIQIVLLLLPLRVFSNELPSEQGGSSGLSEAPRTSATTSDRESVTTLGPKDTTPEMRDQHYQCALKKAKAYHEANKAAQQLSDTIVLIDYDAPSNTQRMTIVDLKTGKVKRYTVAHGLGGTNTRAGSRGSELGFMKFAETLHTKAGLSIRIDGLEPDNKDARERGMILHGAKYVKEGRNAGRSWGSLAVDQNSLGEIVRQIKKNTLLYSYKGSSVCSK